MKISAINLNNFKLQNQKQKLENKTVSSTQKETFYTPTTLQYLAFCGGYSIDLNETYKHLYEGQYPPDIQNNVQNELEIGNP